MTDVHQLLGDAFDDLGRQAPHDPDLAGSVRRRARRQGAVAGSVLAVLAVVGVSTVVAVGRPGGASVQPAGGATASPTPPPRTVGCPEPETGALPEWARTGFSNPEAGGVPFVRGAKGDIVAVLFGPLTAPPLPDRNNKILWVPRVTLAGPLPLVIEARLDGTGPVVRREVPGGPGPSGVDLPQPGCWHLDLRWGGSTDSLSLRYVPG
jgi:hypothetical protein